MDSIKFIPKNQKNLEDLVEFKDQKKGQSLIYTLGTLFVIYTVIVAGSYWYFIVQEKNRVAKAIGELDSVNGNYYITSNLDQDLFNIVSLIENNYDSVEAVKSVESVYLKGAGVSVSSFSYSKIDKTINISMTAQSLNDTTKQVSAFRNLPVVAIVNLSPVTYDKLSGFEFSIEIILK